MRGWVYVISSDAMPGLIKIGYSSKDPELRAAELGNTGNPSTYLVVYDVLVVDPYEIEQRTHAQLSDKRVGKEWFNATASEAIVAIQEIAGEGIIYENFASINRETILKEKQEEENKKEWLRAWINRQKSTSS